jgi:outer membrane protein
LISATRRWSLILITTILVGMAAVPARAQAKLPPAIVAVIDYDKVRRDSKAGKSIRDQIEARRKTYQDQIDKEGKRLLAQDQELSKQRSVLSAEAFSEKKKALDGEARKVQRLAQERLEQLGEVGQVALRQMEEAFLQVLEGLSDERGFNVVMPRSAVLVFSPAIDLTQEVMTRLDQKLPSVKVPDKAPERPKK